MADPGSSSAAGGVEASVSSFGGAGARSGAAGAAGVVATETKVIGDTGICPAEERTEAPTRSITCQVATRGFDSTCADTECAITKALDLTCTASPDQSLFADVQLFGTDDGAVVTVKVQDFYTMETLHKIMTIGATDSRVDDISAPASLRTSTFSVDKSELKWLFAEDGDGVVIATRETDAGWTRTTLAPSSFNGSLGADLTRVSMVDDRLGYFTYSGMGDQTLHLVEWDGACWTDQIIGESKLATMALMTDTDNRPWVAWLSTQDAGAKSLYLRNPDGDLLELAGDLSDGFIDGAPIRLLPAPNGTSADPTIAVRFEDGVRMFSGSQNTGLGGQPQLLSGSGPTCAPIGDCAPVGPMKFGNFDACSGVDTCEERVSGAGIGFDLTRTRSGSVFAAWVVYTGQGTYVPKMLCERGGGEMGPMCYCGRTEAGGTGTADLVVARLTGSESILNHFRFDMGGALLHDNDVAIAARGDTLLVAAYLSDQSVPTLTYLEIDSTKL